MSLADHYRACAAQGMTVVEIARSRGVTPQSVRWVERRHELRIKRDRVKRVSEIECALSPNELADFRFLRGKKFNVKDALTAVRRVDLLEGLK